MTNLDAYLEPLVAWRRYLHRFPEVSFEEHETVAYIEAQLRERLTTATFRNPTPTSLVVTIDTGKPGPKIGVRADIDGLAVQENRPDLEFASELPNRMHACGHDAHTATVMALTCWVEDNRADLTGEFNAIFQHAEEIPPGGAEDMVATGEFNDYDYIFGFHYWATAEVGTVDIKEGAASSNSDLFEIQLTGRGGHASLPASTIDSVVIAANLVNQIQTIVSRRVAADEPVVISTDWLEAGSQGALNVIPAGAKLGGSIRTTSDEARATVRSSLEQFCAAAEAANPGLKAELDYLVGYDRVWNDPARTRIVRELAQARLGDGVVNEPPMMGGEDFSAFSQVAPATYVFIGAADGYGGAHHSPTFGVNEDAFPIALQLCVDVVKNGPRLAAG